MTRKLKVFGGLTFMGRHHRRTIIRAETQKEAATLLGVSLHYFRQYWCETANTKELEAAQAHPPRTALIENSQSEFVTKEEWTL